MKTNLVSTITSVCMLQSSVVILICFCTVDGQQSDIWSLGIILYELLALVLPFQAGNLPALVVRICTSNPNYSILSKRYSNSVVELVSHTYESSE